MFVQAEKGLSLRVLGPRELAVFIKDQRMDIAAYFLTEARRTVPAAADKSTGFLLDHLPQVLEAMSRFIEDGGSAEAQRKAVVLAQKHARERLQEQDYTVSQIQQEYAIVREAIIALIGTDVVFDKESLNLFAHISELTLAVVIETFLRSESDHETATN